MVCRRHKSLQVCKSASLQVGKSASRQVCKSASLQVCNLQVSHTAKYVIGIYRSKSKVTIWLTDATTHLKSQLGINRTYNSNSTAWEFQIYWSNAEKYRPKGSNKISYNRHWLINQYTTDYYTQIMFLPMYHNVYTTFIMFLSYF